MGQAQASLLDNCKRVTKYEASSFLLDGFQSTASELDRVVQVLCAVPLPKFENLEATNGDLQDVPPFWQIPSLRRVVLDGNLIQKTRQEMLQAKDVRELSLARNFLESESLSVLLQLPSLTFLCCAHNRIREVVIPPSMSSMLLTTLDLENNAINDMTPLTTLSSLENLKLSNNLLVQVPVAVSNLQRLHTLHLQLNQLEDVSALSTVTTLRYLYLNNNNISRAPFDELAELRVLALQHNVITSLDPHVFAKMQYLQTLALNDNVLLSLPPSVGKLVSMNRLFLHENTLVTLPPEIGDCEELTTLRVEYNELRNLPAELGKLKCLMLLIAHNNKITEVPDAILNMPQLMRLSLEFNPMKSVDGTGTLDIKRGQQDTLSMADLADFKATDDFNRAFEHFVETRDLSKSKAANFIKAPSHPKLQLMKQHRDAVLRLFIGGRIGNDATDNVEAIAAHQMDPMALVQMLRDNPTHKQLTRLNAGLQEFQDAWFGLFIEYGGFDELLRLLHRMYLQKSDSYREECLLPALEIFETIFDAVWKTVLVTHSSVPVLLLHINSRVELVSSKVLEIVLAVALIPDVGSPILLKAFATRKRMIGDTAPRLTPLYRLAAEGAKPAQRILAMKVVNAVLDQTPLAERQTIRQEWLALHPQSPQAFLEMLEGFCASDNELNIQLDAFIDLLREDNQKLNASKTGTITPTDANVVAARTQNPVDDSSKQKRMAKLKVKESPFDVTSVPPLVKLRLKRTPLLLTERIAKVTRSLVSLFQVDPNLDYKIYYLGPDQKEQIWLDEDKTIADYEGIVIDETNATQLFFSLKAVPMAVRLPSGENRTISMVLQSLVSDVLTDLRKAINLPDGTLHLAVNGGKDRLAPTQSCAKQGVEPYTLLYVVTDSADGGVAPNATEASEGQVLEKEMPDNNIWEEPSGAKYIIIENGEVTSATLNKLIERMTSIDTIDSQLTQTFLITYKSFTTPEKIWAKLLERYEAPERVSDVDRGKVRIRVCMFLKKWMEARQVGEIRPELLMPMLDFIEKRLASDGLNDMQAALFRLMTGAASEKVISYDRRQAPKPKIPKVRALDKMTVLDIDSTELARQITIKTWEIYCLIQPNELFNQAWMKKDADKTSPNALNLIKFFNNISSAIACIIVSEPRVRKRAVLMERFIEVATELRKLNNYHMVMSFISAFAQASINRLVFTMERVSEVNRAKLKELQTLMNPEKSFQQYRAAYNQSGGIPYLGAYLTDLTFIEEATLSYVGGRINMQKHTMVYGVLQKLMLLKRKLPLQLEAVEPIQQWIAKLTTMSDKELYEASLQIEPRGAESVK